MKSLKNNKTILAVIPVTVVLAAGIAFFCSHSGNSSSQCSQNVERLKELETADISAIEEDVYKRQDLARGSVGVLSTSQFISLFTFAAGVGLLVLFGRRKQKQA